MALLSSVIATLLDTPAVLRWRHLNSFPEWSSSDGYTSNQEPWFQVATDYTQCTQWGSNLSPILSIPLHVPPVVWEEYPSSPPSLLPKCSPFTERVPAGRQCHHSAASSSAWLNTGAKVQTQRDQGRNNMLSKEKNNITHSYFSLLH